MDFAWLLYIGMNKLGFTEKQVGHMTFKKWNKLYDAYKSVYDKEYNMKNRGLTYAQLEYEPTIDDVIPM